MRKEIENEIKISIDEILMVVKEKHLNISKELIENVSDYIGRKFRDDGRIKFSFAHKSSDEDVSKRFIVRENSIPITRNEPKVSNPKGLKATALTFFVKKELEDAVYESFADVIFRYISEKGFTDSEVYKRVNIDRRLFSKLRSVKEYNPSRDTAIKLAIALELDLHKTESLIRKAGYAISNGNKRDLIIKYFIENGIYNLAMLNEMLFAFGEDTLD